MERIVTNYKICIEVDAPKVEIDRLIKEKLEALGLKVYQGFAPDYQSVAILPL